MNHYQDLDTKPTDTIFIGDKYGERIVPRETTALAQRPAIQVNPIPTWRDEEDAGVPAPITHVRQEIADPVTRAKAVVYQSLVVGSFLSVTTAAALSVLSGFSLLAWLVLASVGYILTFLVVSAWHMSESPAYWAGRVVAMRLRQWRDHHKLDIIERKKRIERDYGGST